MYGPSCWGGQLHNPQALISAACAATATRRTRCAPCLRWVSSPGGLCWLHHMGAKAVGQGSPEEVHKILQNSSELTQRLYHFLLLS